MPTTSELGTWTKISFTSSQNTVAYTSMTEIECPKDQIAGGGGAKIIRLACDSAASSGTATLILASVHRRTREPYWVTTASVAARSPALRMGTDGASGNYSFTVSFAQTSTDKEDVLGLGKDCMLLLGSTANSIAGATDVYVTWSDEV